MAEDQPNHRELGFYFALAQVGLEIVGCIGLGLLLDHWLGWSPWGLIGGTILGFTGTMVHLISMVNRHDREKKNQEKKP